MSKELKRMQKLAGVPAKKESKSLNEHQIGGIVGVRAINQIPPREKSDYEMAFEHFMTEGEEKGSKYTELVYDGENKYMDFNYSSIEMDLEKYGKTANDLEDFLDTRDVDVEPTDKEIENWFNDDTMEEAVGIPASAEALKLEILKIMNSHRSDSDLGAAIRKKFTPTFDSQDSYSSNRPTTMKDREEETRRNFAQRGMGAI